ncbi:MAG: pyridoxal 5'-phosphate synthase glutaminase subunit PdxT [Desulfobacteraceae bacterium]|nr:MAG: pyridoxal 5'-phosphate synthase glutaminase subunit PdxT [Desulfobacteraceae bacterium]
MRVGLLGLQGAFLDHIPHLKRCGVEPVIVRDAQALSTIDRLIIPGGESTVMSKFLQEFGMLRPLGDRVSAGLPVWGVCAGAILLSQQVNGSPGVLAALPISLTRNAYGRQIASDTRPIDIALLDLVAYPAVFIRAPRIDRVGEGVVVHAVRDRDPVFIQKDHIMASTFHPELNPDDAFHRYFISL